MRKFKNFIMFLGTAGARYVVSSQIRASGGIWLEFAGTRILIDPGPGTLVQVRRYGHLLDPAKLDAIVLTHRHVDHSCDINVLVEAMTLGGAKPRGTLVLPADALDPEPVIYRYAQQYLEQIEIMQPGGEYPIGRLRLTTPCRLHHGVETYGLKFSLGKYALSVVADTAFFPELTQVFAAEIMILNTVRLLPTSPGEGVHLCVGDTKRILEAAKPTLNLGLLTHFGLSMLEKGPESIAQKLSTDLGRKVIAAQDGMIVVLDLP